MIKYKKSGIYMILNLKTEKRYYGSSINLTKRFQRHRDDLRHGHHKNKELLKDWEELGEANFNFIVLEYTEENLGEKERNLIQGGKEVYNIQIPDNNGKQIFCAESTKEKLRGQSRIKRGKTIIGTKEGVTTEYLSINEAARQLGCKIGRIQEVLCGKKKVTYKGKKKDTIRWTIITHYKGHVFKYKE